MSVSFDKEDFRSRALAKAKARLAERSGASKVDPKSISAEELRVIEAYRKWNAANRLKEEDDGATAPAVDMAAESEAVTESKEQRIDQLKRKLERRQRVEALKTKLVEKRDAEKPNALREQARSLKERIKNVRAQLIRVQEGAPANYGAPVSPVAPPVNTISGSPAETMPLTPEGIPDLPPEITAEIQNIATAAQSLAQMAGVAPNTPQPGADLDAGIPPETPGPTSTGMLPESRENRIARIRKVLEEKKKAEKDKEGKDKDKSKDDDKKARQKEGTEDSYFYECPKCHCYPCKCDESDEGDKMIEQARARAEQRREALRQIRSRAMNEKSYEAEDQAGEDVKNFVSTALDTAGAMGGSDYSFVHKDALQKAGVSKDGPSASMPGKDSLKAAKVWTAKDLSYGGKIPDSLPKTPDVNPLKTGGGAMKESTEDVAWDSRHVDHFLERKEFSFKEMLAQGLLG